MAIIMNFSEEPFLPISKCKSFILCKLFCFLVSTKSGKMLYFSFPNHYANGKDIFLPIRADVPIGTWFQCNRQARRGMIQTYRVLSAHRVQPDTLRNRVRPCVCS